MDGSSRHGDKPARPDFLLGALWWMFSPNYRRLIKPQRAERYFAEVAEAEGGISRAQAIAVIDAQIPRRSPMRALLAHYR